MALTADQLRIIARFYLNCAEMMDAADAASDSFVALGRAAADMIRRAEEELTVEQRLRYYELRDQGEYPLDALAAARGEE